MSAADSISNLQLTGADVERWEAQACALDLEAADLQAKAQERSARAEAIRARAQKARDLFALLREDQADVEPEPEPEPEPPAPIVAAVELSAEKIPEKQQRKLRKGSWAEALQKWIYGADDGLSPTELRALIAESEDLQARFVESDKGYYHALSRLQKDKTIIRYGGRYFSPKTYSEKGRLQASDDGFEPIPVSRAYSPMGEAIMDIVSASPGIAGPDIIKKLRTDAEFNATLTPNTSGAYNIIARLSKRGQIERKESQCFPGPKIGQRDPRSKWIAGEARANGHEIPQIRGPLL